MGSLYMNHNFLVSLILQCILSYYLQVLEGVIKYRWNALPVEQRDGMKNYISDVIVKVLSFSVGEDLENEEALGSSELTNCMFTFSFP